MAASGAGAQADAALTSSQTAIDEQRRQFDITQKNQQPWLTAGTQAIQTLQYLMGLGMPPGQATQATAQITGMPEDQLRGHLRQLQDIGNNGFGGRPGPFNERSFDPSSIRMPSRGAPGSTIPGGYSAGDFGSLNRNFGASDFQADPGYDFRLQEGYKALERSAAARGTVLSGGTLKELAQYNQGFASNEYSNAYNRFQQNRATRFNQLAAISGVGQMTATELGRQGAENATNIGNLTIGGQTAAAAARASGYSAWGNAIGNAANLPLNWMALSKMSGQGGAMGTPSFSGYPVPGYPGGPS